MLIGADFAFHDLFEWFLKNGDASYTVSRYLYAGKSGCSVPKWREHPLFSGGQLDAFKMIPFKRGNNDRWIYAMILRSHGSTQKGLSNVEAVALNRLPLTDLLEFMSLQKYDVAFAEINVKPETNAATFSRGAYAKECRFS